MKLLIAFCIVVLSIAYANAETLTGRVVKIADGDTVTVLDSNNAKHRVRLSGIDAPEKNQPFGHRSKQHLSKLVAGKQVTIAYDKRDRYGRIIGKVMVAAPVACDACPKTLDAGLAQITVGLAWWYREYSKEQSEEDRHRYEFAETEAHAKKAGLWADKNPVPPWVWRKTGGQKAGPEGCVIKGNINSKGEKIYHVPSRSSYAATRIDESKGERWFCTVDEALSAGWRAPGQ